MFFNYQIYYQIETIRTNVFSIGYSNKQKQWRN